MYGRVEATDPKHLDCTRFLLDRLECIPFSAPHLPAPKRRTSSGHTHQLLTATMALPGLGDDDVPVSQEQEPVRHELAAGTEWRFEIAYTESVEVKLISGSAELFGTELAPQHTYSFRGMKGAIYTHEGASISSLGVLQSDYNAQETPMTSYVNLHFALDSLRTQAGTSSAGGPRVLVLGPPNAGKTSLCKLLSAYALRNGSNNLMAVNLNPKGGMYTLPGTLSAAALSGTLDVEAEDGWGSAPTNLPMHVPAKLPLVYYFGREEPETDEAGFQSVVSRLALSVVGRLNEDPEAKQAGMIIDAPGTLGAGKSALSLEHVVAEFSVNVLVVLGSERLYSDLMKRFSRPDITVVKLDRSGGSIDKDAGFTLQERQEQVHEYFYGDSRVMLNPHSTFVDWSEIAVFKLPEQDKSAMNAALLPGGVADLTMSAPILQRVSEMDAELHGSVLAIMNADPSVPLEQIRAASVIGFVHVVEVDDKKRRLKLLAPLSGRLPRRTLLWGSWPEQIELNSAR